MNLDEISRLHERARLVAVGAEGGDERREHDHARIEKQLGHFSDPPDVLFPVVIREAQVFAEAVADVVAVENIAAEAAAEQLCIHRIGQGAFAAARQAGEPEDGAVVTLPLRLAAAIYRGLMPDDIAGFDHVAGFTACIHRHGRIGWVQEWGTPPGSERRLWIDAGHGCCRGIAQDFMGGSVAGNQATGLAEVTSVVQQGLPISVGEGTARCQQHRFGGCHVPVLGGCFAGKGDVEVGFAAQDRRHLASHTSARDAAGDWQGAHQLLEPVVAVAAAGDGNQARQRRAPTQGRGVPFPIRCFLPGDGGLDAAGVNPAEPELIKLREQHHAEGRALLVHQGEMHGVLAGALKKVFGAIEGVEDPQPVVGDGLIGRPLARGFLAEDGSAGGGEGVLQPLDQMLVDGQIGGRDRPFGIVIH